MAARRRSMERPRRKRVWARELDSGAISAGGVTHFDLLSSFVSRLGAGLVGTTIGRIRLSTAFETTSTPANLDALTVGVLVDAVSADALDHDPSSITGGMHLDWMYWSKLYPSAVSVTDAIPGLASWEIDIKAQRRMEEIDQTLWLVVSAQITPTLAGNFSYGVSSLVVLP